ncbi:hemerythrin domain-containing protein [Sphingomonas sp. GB1N7]|uniref:hemerythrin domain-containing protein n=1 Tax=Parasphingomonas caseinilytica TaxID=3096158 RepID=UPI002FCA1E56
MIERSTLSDEHAAILEIAGAILDIIAQPDFDVILAIKMRWRLGHSLAVHLAKEDKIIYPRLKQQGSAQVADLAQRFEREMGGLSVEYQRYMVAWAGESIRADRDAFRADTRRILSLLALRVEREEAELYPMYEASSESEDAAGGYPVTPIAKSG